MDTARAIVDEERRKNHSILAIELMRILNNGVAVMTPTLTAALQPPPRDQERRTPLLDAYSAEIGPPYRYKAGHVHGQIGHHVEVNRPPYQEVGRGAGFE